MGLSKLGGRPENPRFYWQAANFLAARRRQLLLASTTRGLHPSDLPQIAYSVRGLNLCTRRGRSASGPTTGVGSLREASKIFSPAASAHGSTPPHSCQPESSFFTPHPSEPNWEPTDVITLESFRFAAHVLRDLTNAWRLVHADWNLDVSSHRWELAYPVEEETKQSRFFALTLLGFGLTPLLARFHPYVGGTPEPSDAAPEKPTLPLPNSSVYTEAARSIASGTLRSSARLNSLTTLHARRYIGTARTSPAVESSFASTVARSTARADARTSCTAAVNVHKQLPLATTDAGGEREHQADGQARLRGSQTFAATSCRVTAERELAVCSA